MSLLAACGGSDDEASEASADPTVTEPAAIDPAPTDPAAPAAGAFPVTIEHRFGSTTVTEVPQRIVAVGLTEQDALLALGVVPVGTTEWFGEHPGAIWPWAQDELEALGGVAPTIVGDATAVSFEAVAEQQPDLILAMYSGLTDADYQKLAAIAPTVAQPGDFLDYGVPWEEATRIVGQVVGKADEAEALVEEVAAEFAAAREQYPEFAGAEAVTATPYEGIFVYGPQDVRSRFLTELGMVVPDWVEEVTGDEFGGNLSAEQAELLDIDLIVWLDAAEAGDDFAGPLYNTFAVHTEGREVHLSSFTDTLGGATSFVTVLSLPYLLEGLAPMMAAALDGDPATVVVVPG